MTYSSPQPQEHPITTLVRDKLTLRDARIADCRKWIATFDQLGATGLVALYREALARELEEN